MKNTDFDPLALWISNPLEHGFLQQKQGSTQDNKKIVLHNNNYDYYFNSEMKLKKPHYKNPKRMIKENSLKLVMRITTVSQLVKCT